VPQGLDGPISTFEVELDKPVGAKLGIDVMLVSGNGQRGLVVGSVLEGGCVDLWNRCHEPPNQVQRNDYIVQVNNIGAENGLTKMAEEFATDRCICRFTIQRGLGVPLLAKSERAGAKEASKPAVPGPMSKAAGLFGTGIPPPPPPGPIPDILGGPGMKVPSSLPSTRLAAGQAASAPGASGPPPPGKLEEVPVKLLLETLRLPDAELKELLRSLLRERPWLAKLVEDALRTRTRPTEVLQ